MKRTTERVTDTHIYLKYTCENRGYWIEIEEIELNNFDNILV